MLPWKWSISLNLPHTMYEKFSIFVGEFQLSQWETLERKQVKGSVNKKIKKWKLEVRTWLSPINKNPSAEKFSDKNLLILNKPIFSENLRIFSGKIFWCCWLNIFLKIFLKIFWKEHILKIWGNFQNSENFIRILKKFYWQNWAQTWVSSKYFLKLKQQNQFHRLFCFLAPK